MTAPADAAVVAEVVALLAPEEIEALLVDGVAYLVEWYGADEDAWVAALRSAASPPCAPPSAAR